MTESAAPPVPPNTPPANEAAIPDRSRLQRFWGGLAMMVVEVIGLLVVFPVFVGLIIAGLVMLDGSGSGGNYEQGFIIGAGLAAVIGGGILVVRMTLRLLPIIFVIVGVMVAWKLLT